MSLSKNLKRTTWASTRPTGFVELPGKAPCGGCNRFTGRGHTRSKHARAKNMLGVSAPTSLHVTIWQEAQICATNRDVQGQEEVAMAHASPSDTAHAQTDTAHASPTVSACIAASFVGNARYVALGANAPIAANPWSATVFPVEFVPASGRKSVLAAFYNSSWASSSSSSAPPAPPPPPPP